MHSLSFEDPSISWRGRGEPPAFFRSLVSRYFELATSRRLTKLNKWNDRPTCPVTRIRNGFGFSNRRTGRHRRAFQRFRRVASGSITLHLAINPPDFSVAFHRSVPKRDGSRGCGNARTLALLVSRQQFSRSKFRNLLVARYIYNYFVECNFATDPLPPIAIQLSVRWKLDFER